MDDLTIAVTGINASDNPAPGIGVAKSLKESKKLKVKIIGLAYDAMEPGIYMDWVVDKAYLVPYPSADGAAVIERLLYIKQSFGLDMILPTLDSELPFYMKYQQELLDKDIKTILPAQKQFAMRDKSKLAEIAEKTGISAPEQALVSSYEALQQAVDKIGLPVMVKGNFYKAYRANTMEQCMAYYGKLVAEWGHPVIIQEIVVGDEMNVIGVGDGEGNAPGLVAVKKMSITELGKMWTGVTVNNENLLAATKRFVYVTHWNGAFEMECIVTKEQKVYLIEVNPRFPAWVYFATGVGINLPELLVQRMLEQPLEPVTDYEAGKLYIRYTGEQVCDMTRFQDMATKGES